MPLFSKIGTHICIDYHKIILIKIQDLFRRTLSVIVVLLGKNNENK